MILYYLIFIFWIIWACIEIAVFWYSYVRCVCLWVWTWSVIIYAMINVCLTFAAILWFETVSVMFLLKALLCQLSLFEKKWYYFNSMILSLSKGIIFYLNYCGVSSSLLYVGYVRNLIIVFIGIFEMSRRQKNSSRKDNGFEEWVSSFILFMLSVFLTEWLGPIKCMPIICCTLLINTGWILIWFIVSGHDMCKISFFFLSTRICLHEFWCYTLLDREAQKK